MDEHADRFAALFQDLEAQATAQDRHERLAQVPDLARESLADLNLAQRLAAALGQRVDITTTAGRFAGTLERTGRGWVCLGGDMCVLIALAAVHVLRLDGPAHAKGDLLTTLGIGSPLRELQAVGSPVRVHVAAGGTVEGTIDGVAADYIQLRGAGRPRLLPLHAIEAVQVM